MAASGWRRVVAACVLGLAVSMTAAQEKPVEKKYPTAGEVADLLKRDPIALENWAAWRGRLLDWINDRGQGTDPAFDAARKFIRTQAIDKDELNPALAKDALAWYLLAGSYFADEPDTKTKGDSIAVAKRAEKAVRKSIELDPKLAQAHRNLALYLLKEEENAPGELEDMAKLTPRLEEAVKHLDEAARLNPQAPIGHVRALLGSEAYKQERFAPAEAQLRLALKEDPEQVPALATQTALAMLRSPRLKDYPETVAALEQLCKEYPKEPGPRFVLGLTLIQAGSTLAGYESFNRGMELGGDPAKLIPQGELNRTARSIISNKGRTWQQAARDLQVLAAQFPRDGEMAVIHGLARYEASDYEQASSELKRARGLGTSPEAVLDKLARGSGVKLTQQILFHGIIYRVLVPFLWILGVIAALYGLAMTFMIAVTPQPIRPTEGTSVAAKPASAKFRVSVLATAVVGFALFYVVSMFIGLSHLHCALLGLIGVGVVTLGVHYFEKQEPIGAEEPPALVGLYPMAILAGVGLFYAALLFMFVVLAVVVVGLFYLLLAEFSIYLLVSLAVFVAIAWLFVSMVLAGPAKGKRGIAVRTPEIAQLRQTIDGVARQLDTEPVDEVRLTAGTGVTLYMFGRGTLGLLGGRRRVLVLGYTALRLLTVPELQALVAQQLAPLGRREGERGRLIYRCWLGITDALEDMRRHTAETGWINPCYYVLMGYYRVLARLAGPYIRGRIAQADQTAAKLHGGAVLESAMLKLHADAPLYKARLDHLVKELIVEAPDLSNMYAAWDELCPDSGIGPQNDSLLPAATLGEMQFALLAVSDRERNQARGMLLAAKSSARQDLPGPGARIQALRVKPKPDKAKKDSTDIASGSTAAGLRKDEPGKSVVTELLDNAEALEEHLTEVSINIPAASAARPPAEELSAAK
ncbi:hypothetical protein AYO44_12920 [Planctomycetaceae bacterium SCGC AG-212-F19]|nr:hypothetical protein AYO44_12920 [Planctomycetaceae bacterium SCGC AG-212-F19]